MDWCDDAIDRLIGGDVLNIVGLEGSGRSRSLAQLAAQLRADDLWSVLQWSAADLQATGRRAFTEKVRELRTTERVPVLLIDDFGEFLLHDDGQWLERFLFAQVNEPPSDDLESLRCVVVTSPRDREVVGPGSGLRERSRELAPAIGLDLEFVADLFGFLDDDELFGFCGGNRFLAGAGGETPEQRRGIARSVARARLPHWVGQLDTSHQYRLAQVVSRPTPPRWRDSDSDPILSPLAVRATIDGVERCALPTAVDGADVGPLLVGQPWPDRAPVVAARRFVARCGNEPSPLWSDNFLSDTEALDFQRLVDFLHAVLGDLPPATTLRVLSRNWVGGQPVLPTDIASELVDAGLRSDAQTRIVWRLYDGRRSPNLHRRELLLPRRGAAFTLPPALVVVGQASAGNETDSPAALASSAATVTAWRAATPIVFPP